MASTSSVYGANKNLPFDEFQKTDNQISFYAATKKTNEIMSHYYSHMYNLPVTMFRFFTVYGPWEGLIWHCLNLQKYHRKQANRHI